MLLVWEWNPESPKRIPILPALCEALVQIRADYALIQLCPAYILHAVQSILVGVIFDKAESTRRLLVSVQPHDDPLDLTTSSLNI